VVGTHNGDHDDDGDDDDNDKEYVHITLKLLRLMYICGTMQDPAPWLPRLRAVLVRSAFIFTFVFCSTKANDKRIGARRRVQRCRTRSRWLCSST
jgi:hypothetical protein